MFPENIQVPRIFFYDRIFALKMVLDRLDESNASNFILRYKTISYDLIHFAELKQNREWQRICYNAMKKTQLSGDATLADWFSEELARYKQEEAEILRRLQ